MKAHKYWSIGALITMIGTFYTGYRGLKSSHKYFALLLLFCLMKELHSSIWHLRCLKTDNLNIFKNI